MCFFVVSFFALSSLWMRGNKAMEDSRAQVTGGMIKDGRFSIIHRKPHFLDTHWITNRTGKSQRERKKWNNKGGEAGREERDRK